MTGKVRAVWTVNEPKENTRNGSKAKTRQEGEVETAVGVSVRWPHGRTLRLILTSPEPSPVFILAWLLYDKLHLSHSYHSGFNTLIAQSICRMQTVLNNLHFAFVTLEFTRLWIKTFYPRLKINIFSVLDSISVPVRQPETFPWRLDNCPSARRDLPAPTGPPEAIEKVEWTFSIKSSWSIIYLAQTFLGKISLWKPKKKKKKVVL